MGTKVCILIQSPAATVS